MTSEQAKFLIETAHSYVGTIEEGINSGPLVELFQKTLAAPHKEPWCVDFAFFCVREVDKKIGSQTILFPTESSQILWLKTPKIARIDYPTPGCLVIWTKFNGDSPTSVGHVGIVSEIIDSEFMLTIEGNTSPDLGVEREGDGVYLKKRHLKMSSGNMRIAGFLLPWI